jgi:hypothetical protein
MHLRQACVVVDTVCVCVLFSSSISRTFSLSFVAY